MHRRIIETPKADAIRDLKECAAVVKNTLYEWFDLPDDDLDEPIPTIPFSQSDEPRLRLSYGNGCAREKWYQHNEPESFVRTSTERWKFFLGHVFEHLAQIGLSRRLPEPYEWHPEWVQRTVKVHDIEGHTDGAIFRDGKPLAMLDFKCTNPYSFKHWEQERKPPGTWGHPHQAANYLAAARREGVDFPGFIWAVGFRDQSRWEIGWMSADELRPWEEEAQKAYEQAKTSEHPPPPVHSSRNQSPCRYRDTIYCNCYERCINDHR